MLLMGERGLLKVKARNECRGGIDWKYFMIMAQWMSKHRTWRDENRSEHKITEMLHEVMTKKKKARRKIVYQQTNTFKLWQIYHSVFSFRAVKEHKILQHVQDIWKEKYEEYETKILSGPSSHCHKT